MALAFYRRQQPIIYRDLRARRQQRGARIPEYTYWYGRSLIFYMILLCWLTIPSRNLPHSLQQSS